MTIHRRHGIHGQQRIERLPCRDPVLEFLCFGLQRTIVQLLERGLQRIDALHRLAVLLDQPIITAAENFGEDIGRHECKATPSFA